MKYFLSLLLFLSFTITAAEAKSNDTCTRTELGDMVWQLKCFYPKAKLEEAYQIVKQENKEDIDSKLLPTVIPKATKTYKSKSGHDTLVLKFFRKNKNAVVFQYEVLPDMAEIEWKLNENINGVTFIKTVTPP